MGDAHAEIDVNHNRWRRGGDENIIRRLAIMLCMMPAAILVTEGVQYYARGAATYTYARTPETICESSEGAFETHPFV